MAFGCHAPARQPETSPVEPVPGKVIRVDGARLVDPTGAPITLRGVAFGNQVWTNVREPRQHHDERDYARLAEVGMNSVRFYLNAVTLVDPAAPGVYREAGWRWLDDNVAWAKAHGVRLVLNMHVPPGGYQSLGKGRALWDDAAKQQEFIDLWVAIARRYRLEDTIAGYDILNEPVVTESKDQWRALAERTIEAIRAVDPEHVVFVERVNAIDGDWREDRDRNFFRVSDPNVVYEFHFYKPFHFTHQGAPWVDFSAESAKYPDPTRAEVEWFLLDWSGKRAESASVPPGDSPWQRLSTAPLRVDDAALALARPALECSRVGQGKVWFDQLTLVEAPADGSAPVTLFDDDLATPRGWYFHKPDGAGSVRAVDACSAGRCLVVSGTTGEANLGGDPWRVPVRLGATYTLHAEVRGEQVPADATCRLVLDFPKSTVPVHTRGKDFLRQELEAYLAWGRREGVPLCLGEWGTIRGSFEEGRGGLAWVSDMLDLLLEHDVSFAYHDYHEVHMGIFEGDGALPDPARANAALLELFQLRLTPR